MGTFRYPVRVGRLDGTAFETVEALVDTGATYAWIPSTILERLGIPVADRRRLQLANGEIVERPSGLVLVTIDGITVATTCIFGDPDSIPLLGAVALEECGLAPDPVARRLVPVVGLLATLASGPPSLPGSPWGPQVEPGRAITTLPSSTAPPDLSNRGYPWT